MKYFMYPVIVRTELEDAIKLQYDVEVDIVDLFFSYGCENMEFLTILSEEDELEDEGDFFGKQRKLIRGFLRDIMPEDTDTVIIEFDY